MRDGVAQLGSHQCIEQLDCRSSNDGNGPYQCTNYHERMITIPGLWN